MKVRIHTAGAAQGNPGPGGYAAVLMPFENPVVVCGNNVSTDEEEMGLRAIVEGITQAWTIFGNEIRESPSISTAVPEASWMPREQRSRTPLGTRKKSGRNSPKSRRK